MANSKPPATGFEFKIQHIRDEIPAFEVPPYKGERYEDLVPDTLDIQERIALAVNGLTGPTDPDKDHMLYFRVNFRSHPPSMSHGPSDLCQVKFMEALPLLRIASGSELNDHIDPVWMATALRIIGPDGLTYWPALPWARYLDWCEPCPEGEDFYSVIFFCGRAISAMSVYMMRDPDGPWKAEIAKVVQGLKSVAIPQDDFAYFPQGAFTPDGPRRPDAAMPRGIWASLAGWTIHGLAHYHRATGDADAKDLAGKLARYLMYHGKYFGPEGEFLSNWPGEGKKDDGWQQDGLGFNPGPPPVTNEVHFQHHIIPLLGTLEHALAAGDTELAEFVRMSYEWARGQGDETVGYFPENLNSPNEFQTSELCEVAGMIALALKLSMAGLGDYWDDADRWIRNQFAEGQLVHADWIYHVSEGGLVSRLTRIPPSAIGADLSAIDNSRENADVSAAMSSDTCDHVPERNIGAFASWPTANDWYAGHGSGIAHCCTGNATRALYYIWQHIVSHEDGVLSVNLLLNHATQWADIHSHIPYAGQLDLVMKQACRELRVRIPEWTAPDEASGVVNNEPCALEWDGRYAIIADVGATDKVSIRFPIEEKQVRTNIQCQHYHLITRGNDVVDIYPRGEFSPMYQRSHYRSDTTRWKKVERFVASESFEW